MAIDPVCKMTVEEDKAAATTNRGDATYFFCAKACKETFDQDPEKYLQSNQ